MRDPDLSELLTPKQFLTAFPNLVTENSLRWQLRNRRQNGLSAAGAVLEVRQRADQRRPQLFLVPSRYAALLLEQHRFLRLLDRNAT